MEEWLKDVSLPFWSSTGFNAEHDLFHEAMNAAGSPVANTPTRVRVQLRQIYTFSHAAVLGWLPGGETLAYRVWMRLLNTCGNENGDAGFATLLSAQGRVIDETRNSYDHAFAVLAAAWLYAATGDKSVKKALEGTLDFVDRRLTLESGALRDSWPDRFTYRQNPQMHWFEAMLALIETGAHTSGFERAISHRALLEGTLVHRPSFTVAEDFTSDWTPVGYPHAVRVEPGHIAEWAWLLRKHDTIMGASPSRLPGYLLQSTLRYQDPASGLLVDEALSDGTVTRRSRRIWLQTELVKALMKEAEVTGDLQDVMSALGDLDYWYLRQPFEAGWVDCLDQDCQPMPGNVPTSILYHVFVAILEAGRVRSMIPESEPAFP